MKLINFLTEILKSRGTITSTLIALIILMITIYFGMEG